MPTSQVPPLADRGTDPEAAGALALDPSDFRYEMGCWVTRRKPCGCILEICSDDDADITREFLEEARGRNPEHMKFRDAYAEPTFFKCLHREAPIQTGLFGGSADAE